MFKGREILREVNYLKIDSKISHKEILNSLEFITSTLNDLISLTIENSRKIKYLEELYIKNVRDDDQVKEILKDALREYKEEMEKPLKKVTKKK